MIRAALGPLEQRRRVNHDLSFRIQRHFRTVHRARRRAFEVDALAVVTTTMTRALELVFAGFPVGRAAEMSAARIDHEEPIGSARDPDAVLLLPLRINADGVVSRRADAKNARRLEYRTRQEEPHEHEKESGERTGDRRPDHAATH